MLHVLLTLCFALCAPTAFAQERTPTAAAPKSDLGALFARATRDPAGVVPLIVAGSAEIQKLPPKEAALLADTLEPFCRRAFFGSERLPGMDQLGLVLRKVEQGDVPTRIAARCKIAAGLLPYLNEDFDAKRLRVGQELKLLDLSSAPFELVIEKSVYRLYAWKGLADGAKVLVMCAPVGLGAEASPTPVGSTTITKRVLHPDWTHPVTHKVYPDGDPDNVLGGYWIALDSGGIGKSGIGLHGYTGSAAVNWIEQGASNGCVRMLQNDIDRVYNLALEGTSVTIRETAASLPKAGG